MAQITMEIIGDMADIKAGDRVWVLPRGDVGRPSERTVLSVDYEDADDNRTTWKVEGCRVTQNPDDEDYDEDDWDWVCVSDLFLTEKAALEKQQAELETDIQDKVQELADLRTQEHAVRRRLMVLNAEEGPFDGD